MILECEGSGIVDKFKEEITALLKWKIEHNLPRVNFTHSLEKNMFSHTWVDFQELKLASLHACKICNLKIKVRMV